MSEGRIDDLIQAAHNAMEREIDVATSGEWKIECMEYLEEHLGPDHYYTQYFMNFMKEMEHKALLTGGGVLAAAKEEVSRRERG